MDDFMMPLTERELDELEDILMDERVPDDTLDISGLHGFLTAIAIGPRIIMPNEWLPLIFGAELDIPQIFGSFEEAQRVINLILRFYNQVVQELKDPANFIPILYLNKVGNKEIYIIEDWCFGFMRAVLYDADAWEPLLDSPEGEEFITSPFLFGTWAGLESIKDVEEEVHETAAWALPKCVIGIMEFWEKRFREPEFLH